MKKVVYFAKFWFAVPAHRGPTNGREHQTNLENFATFFIDYHSDGENLQVMSALDRDFFANVKFLFLFKHIGFKKRIFDIFDVFH